ncbi:hypothetical protein PISMIDRAFT_11356 [Pisolithus microcarpus 441]|uniref:HAT C-terminal dimerisation domain-containing protein n=1 Tax=Pisolithus microcarpus 441 TaxID=765257 RepID=A0A0C9YD98_9AGAM|nr:hypothetical protein PISMIDRAFT_11356 [Pisolithus microcarpus 441]
MNFDESTSSDSSSIDSPKAESPMRLNPSSPIEQDSDSEVDFKPEPVVIEPIVVANHTWCTIKDIEFDVWIREDGAERIDLDNSKKAAFERGYTYNTLRAELNRPGAEISHLPPPPPPGMDDRVPGGKLPKGDPSVGLPKFSIEGLRKLLVDFIISDNQDTDIPHCTKTRELILQCWQECFMQLRVELKRAVRAISFTADVWSADKLNSYLVMMAHWIGHELGNAPRSGQLAMKAALITFHYLPSSHMGEELAKAILHLTDHAEIPVDKAIDLWVRMPWNINLVPEKLEQMHWEVLQDLEFALQAPAVAHHTMTSECIPLLGGALPAYETFLEQWKRISMSSTNPQFGPLLKEGLAHRERYHKHMHANKAYIFTMFAHPSIHFSWVERKWCNEISSVKASILELMQEYHMKYADDNAQPTPTTMRPAYMGLASLYGLDTMEIMPMAQEQGQLSIKEEFGSYITTTSQADADVLAFWELERARFPTIYRIAMDYLLVQPSSVLCERIFLSSAETDTKK